MKAVTTFPAWGWDVYARYCVDSWLQSWPGSVLAYYEGDAPPASVTGVEFRPLSDVAGRAEFLDIELPEPSSFLFDAKRFCHKVFTQLDAMASGEPFWWIDADVEMLRPIPAELIDDLTDRDFVAFLGRTSYTETGVIAFNPDKPGFNDFRNAYTAAYAAPFNHDGILRRPYWTDCHAFDYARNGGGYNMTPDGRGFDNVMRSSPLGTYMEHHKGNLKLRLEEQV